MTPTAIQIGHGLRAFYEATNPGKVWDEETWEDRATWTNQHYEGVVAVLQTVSDARRVAIGEPPGEPDSADFLDTWIRSLEHNQENGERGTTVRVSTLLTVAKLARASVAARLLAELVAQSKKNWDHMSPEQQEQQLAEQRESWVRGEMGMGSDADEASYRQHLNKVPLCIFRSGCRVAERCVQEHRCCGRDIVPNG